MNNLVNNNVTIKIRKRNKLMVVRLNRGWQLAFKGVQERPPKTYNNVNQYYLTKNQFRLYWKYSSHATIKGSSL